jgi:hypothetical protein
MSAPIPPMDPPPLRTMGDMGMAKMAEMETGSMPGMGKPDSRTAISADSLARYEDVNDTERLFAR